MTDLAQLRQMHRLVQAAYDQEQQTFGAIVAAENALRAELGRVDEMDRDAREMVRNDVEMRAIGSDVIWQSWVGRTRTKLNIRLAKVLSTKEYHLAAVRKAYGKVLVVEALIKETESELATDRRKRDLQNVIDLAVQSN